MGAGMRVLIRADASLTIGTGHVVRCLTLAEKLRDCGADVAFVCRLLDGHLCDDIAARGLAVHRLPGVLDGADVQASAGLPKDAELTQNALGEQRFDWIIVDHYGLDQEWEVAIRPWCDRLLVIDDLANRRHDCDVLLDQNLVAGLHTRYDDLLPPHCISLLGPAHALLSRQYGELRVRTAPREGLVKRLLVSFGGFDQHGLTEMAVRALVDLNMPEVEADIVLASSSPQYAGIQALLATRPQLRLHDRVPSLAPLILAADAALGAGGSTHWERLALGLPALVVTVADNQRPMAAELDRQSLIRWLGDAAQMTPSVLKEHLQQLLSEEIDARWSEQCLKVVDGRGADRVAAMLTATSHMQLVHRHARLDDEDLLLLWSNDRQTRQNAFSTREITAQEHRAWFRRRLRNPADCVFLIFETSFGIPIGQVRFDRRDSGFEISYAVAPPFRGRGLGSTMLRSAIEAFHAERPGYTLIGQVKIDNPASLRIFEQLGFSVRERRPDRLVFELGT
jgi:UDP-2,4-diacetamido-2,4,6-trideoxy-beta-L-altropyranose hydrolase